MNKYHNEAFCPQMVRLKIEWRVISLHAAELRCCFWSHAFSFISFGLKRLCGACQLALNLSTPLL